MDPACRMLCLRRLNPIDCTDAGAAAWSDRESSPPTMNTAATAVLVWSIAAFSIAGIIFRPRQWPEAIWACLGAFLLIVCRLVSASEALAAVTRGTDVYLFLGGMMLLADL